MVSLVAFYYWPDSEKGAAGVRKYFLLAQIREVGRASRLVHKSWDSFEKCNKNSNLSFVYSLEPLFNRQKDKENIFSVFTDELNSIC